MIGPHEGKELALMLAGKKPLAMFHDLVPTSGTIPEEIIPEQAFAPHVTAGTIKRFAADFTNTRNGDTIRYVLFALPGAEWRAEFLLWLNREFYADRSAWNSAHDELTGKLLGYSDADIQDFL
ncbi:MAG: hypothetical protein KDJ35_09265 [Alphaproteobacteria bacterium]|nr:hypothetical protein [Alphaproteobacteria bacterium]